MKSRLQCATALVVLLSSCVSHRYVYSPVSPNLPYFNDKHQIQSSMVYSGNGGLEKGNGMDIQAAYSFAKNWAITAGYLFKKEYGKDLTREVFDSTMIKYRRNLTQFGAGYFIPLNPQKSITFNIYGTALFGKFRQNESGIKNSDLISRYHYNNITGFAIQPSIHFMPEDFFHFAIFIRNSWLHYGGLSTNFLPDEYATLDYQYLDNKTRSFFESGYDLQFGVPKLPWLKLTHSVSFCQNSHVDYSRLRSRWMTASLGLSFQFSAKRK